MVHRCGLIERRLCTLPSDPAGRTRRDVPFLTGQKGAPRRKRAPTVGPVAHLPTLSLPLQGGDSGPAVSARGSVFFSHKARHSHTTSLPWRGEKKGRPKEGHPAERGREEIAPSQGRFPVPSSCPSPSGEGTQGPGDGVRPIDRATGYPAHPGPFAVRRLGRRCDAEGHRKGMTFGPVSRIGQPIRGPDAKQGRQPQRVQPGDVNAVS